ncbi:glycosyltransferase family 4 protein [Albimonas sp. CAU 1670]|uniref:glycosyltransferase family 4 protein n=1 Tax=Albimonas sp. CAU 1670 TaxID=3032599 RepID=UPI0023D9A303|nr:glycosyltransferase family 4 protein [Albimonas sp. CAU 1670]MDF2232804.1 glycosyltransferase family 4 protein [Albimonas sp. CAU 1670]
MKLAYFAGPGDVVGTYRHWREGREDPRVPVRTYSGMFYDLATELDAQALVLHTHEGVEDLSDGRFAFQRVPTRPAEGALAYWREQLRFGRDVARRIDAFGADAAILSSMGPMVSARLIGRRTRIVASLHNTFWPMGRPPQGAAARLKRAILAWTLGPAEGAVCTSVECARQFHALRGAGVPAPVERPVLNRPLRLRAAPERAARFLFVGRVTETKGVFALLEAFAPVAARHPEATLTYVGDGDALEPLAARAAAHPAAERIHVRGRLPAEGVLETMADSDVLVCPTLSGFNEGLALVCIEAAACGVPSIASTVVPARETLGAACRVHEADSTPALAAAMAELADDPVAYRRLAEAARALGPVFRDPSESWAAQVKRLLVPRRDAGRGAPG